MNRILTGYGLEDELLAFFRNSETAYRETGVPVCFGMLHTIFPPCLGAFISCYMESERTRRIDGLVREFNDRHWLRDGFYLQFNRRYGRPITYKTGE